MLESAQVFAEQLVVELKKLGISIRWESVKISSYQGMESTGKPIIHFHFDEQELAGKYVLVIEDMIDSRTTLAALLLALEALQSSVLHVAVLLKN